MKRSTLLAVALAAHIVASHARGAQEPPLMTLDEKFGALVDLCPGFIEAGVGGIINKTKPEDYQRWYAKNEFDGPWRAQIEKEAVESVRGRFAKSFSRDKPYRIGTWLVLGPYDFKASQFPLLVDIYPSRSWGQYLDKKTAIGQDLYLTFLQKDSATDPAFDTFTHLIGLGTAPPRAVVIHLPVGTAGQTTGLVPCANGHGICLQISESEAKSLADPTLNPNRLVHVSMHVKFDACTRKKDADSSDDNYLIHAETAYLAVQATRRHPRNGLLSKIVVLPQDQGPPKEIYDGYSVEESVWEWHAPLSNDAKRGTPSSAQ